MKKIFALLFAGLVAASASALPVRKGIITAVQSDGTVLTLQPVGDEHLNYFIDVNSGRKMQLSESGDYVALSDATLSSMQLQADKRRAEVNARRAERLAERSPYFTAQNGQLTTDGRKKVPGTFNNSLDGKRKGLVILANFANTTIFGLPYEFSTTREQWDDAFNKEGYKENNHVGSVHDYFKDQSYGKFDLEFDVVGPVTVSKSLEYYGTNNTYGSDSHAAEMVAEACQLANEQYPELNFKDYDWDNNGEVDQVYVIYAGYGASSGADSRTIWPHEYWLKYGYGQRLYFDGVYVDTYACSCELAGSGKNSSTKKMTGIGTACHEFSHCIGFPDFYDAAGGDSYGMDAWDVLGSGAYNGPTNNCEVPPGFTAYERWMAGWLEPRELSEGDDIIDMKPLLDEPEAYVIYNDGCRDEYYLLENRQNKKWFSYPSSAHGMLITHVDFDNSAWSSNEVNAVSTHQRMTLVPAAGVFGSFNTAYNQWYTSAEQYRSMLFPGTKNITDFNNTSHINVGGTLFNVNTDGSRRLNKPISEIVEKNGLISFTFKEGKDWGYRWTVTFDAGNGGTVEEASWKQEQNKESFTLPVATPTVEGWKFIGWITEPIGESSERPTEILTAGTTYEPTANVTLYALYGYSLNGDLRPEYRLVDMLTPGRNYVFASKKEPVERDIVALSIAKLSTTAQSKPDGEIVEVDFTGDVPTIYEPIPEIVWSINKSGDYFNVSNDGKYLLISSAGIAVTTAQADLIWNKTYGLGTGASSSTIYVRTNFTDGITRFTASTAQSTSARLFAYEESDHSDKDFIYSTYPAGVPEGISTISIAGSRETYDLQGRRVYPEHQSNHGIYIMGGKKVVR